MADRRQTRRPAGAERTERSGGKRVLTGRLKEGRREQTAGKEGKRVPDEEEIVCVKDITKTNLKGDLRMKRSVYEAPVTDRFQIELEGVFMSGSKTEIQATEDSKVEVEEYDSFENIITFD